MNHGNSRCRRPAVLSLIASLILTLLLTVSCNNGPTPEEVAKAEALGVAQACYDRLQAGDYDGFLAFRIDYDNIPEAMRTQLADAYKMYMATEQQLHKGVKKFTASRAEMDSTMQVMQVFMVLDYGDGTQEEVVVPMTLDDGGQWRMK